MVSLRGGRHGLTLALPVFLFATIWTLLFKPRVFGFVPTCFTGYEFRVNMIQPKSGECEIPHCEFLSWQPRFLGTNGFIDLFHVQDTGFLIHTPTLQKCLQLSEEMPGKLIVAVAGIKPCNTLKQPKTEMLSPWSHEGTYLLHCFMVPLAQASWSLTVILFLEFCVLLI